LTNSHRGGIRKYSTDFIFAILSRNVFGFLYVAKLSA
jgi:cell division protein FtsW (lipid II flippase)